jgi:hypothetical protein
MKHRGGPGVSFAYVDTATIKNNNVQNPGTNLCSLPFYVSRRDNMSVVLQNNPVDTATTFSSGVAPSRR